MIWKEGADIYVVKVHFSLLHALSYTINFLSKYYTLKYRCCTEVGKFGPAMSREILATLSERICLSDFSTSDRLREHESRMLRADITPKAAFFQPLLILVMVKYILPIHTGYPSMQYF